MPSLTTTLVRSCDGHFHSRPVICGYGVFEMKSYAFVAAEIVVAPPFVYIDQVVRSLTKRIQVSAQNSWVGKGGAFTGEIRQVIDFRLGL